VNHKTCYNVQVLVPLDGVLRVSIHARESAVLQISQLIAEAHVELHPQQTVLLAMVAELVHLLTAEPLNMTLFLLNIGLTLIMLPLKLTGTLSYVLNKRET